MIEERQGGVCILCNLWNFDGIQPICDGSSNEENRFKIKMENIRKSAATSTHLDIKLMISFVEISRTYF